MACCPCRASRHSCASLSCVPKRQDFITGDGMAPAHTCGCERPKAILCRRVSSPASRGPRAWTGLGLKPGAIRADGTYTSVVNEGAGVHRHLPTISATRVNLADTALPTVLCSVGSTPPNGVDVYDGEAPVTLQRHLYPHNLAVVATRSCVLNRCCHNDRQRLALSGPLA